MVEQELDSVGLQLESLVDALVDFFVPSLFAVPPDFVDASLVDVLLNFVAPSPIDEMLALLNKSLIGKPPTGELSTFVVKSVSDNPDADAVVVGLLTETETPPELIFASLVVVCIN